MGRFEYMQGPHYAFTARGDGRGVFSPLIGVKNKSIFRVRKWPVCFFSLGGEKRISLVVRRHREAARSDNRKLVISERGPIKS